MEKEMADIKKKEQEEYERKIVVANKHFTVNTRVPASNQSIKYRGMLQDPPNRIGLQLKKSRLAQMASRQLGTTKSLRDFPVSAMMKEPYVMNEQAPKPLKNKLDTTKTPLNRREGQLEVRDFAKYSKANPLTGT